MEQKGVVVATVDVPQGLVLTKDNMGEYFDVKVRNADMLPSIYYEDGYPLLGKVTSRKILANEIVTDTAITVQDVYADVEDPVELAIDVSKIGNAVGGTLRAGDRVDIKAIIDMEMDSDDAITEDAVEEETVGTVDILDVESENQEDIEPTATRNIDDELSDEVRENLELWGIDKANYEYVEGVTGRYLSATIAKNVKVTGVYTSSGVGTKDSEAEGGSQVATVINVVVPRSMQDSIYLALTEGTVYVSKVIDTSAYDVEKDGEEEGQTEEVVEEQ
ncbi:MAG: SAF domain-containing protein [Acetatifactor sp.]|nr:SAF domain-containing protein [Acetatifactor sp.]